MHERDPWTAWALQGMTWSERLAWARRQGPLPVPASDSDLDPWRAAVGDADATGDLEGTGLGERLARAGLTRGQALAALGDLGPERVDPSAWVAWWHRLRDACRSSAPAGDGRPLDDLTDAECLAWLREREEAMPAAALAVPFSALWWPAVVAATTELVRDDPLALEGVSPAAAADLQGWLMSRLGEVAAPTLLAVMSAGRTAGERLLAQLGDEPVDPPRRDYARMCLGLAAGRLDDVMAEYPVLPSLLAATARQWHEATREMLARVRRHRPDLARLTGMDPAMPMTSAAVGAGDRHDDGRSVAVLSFGSARVAYKPRDMRLERLWEQVVGAVNRHLPGDGLRAASVHIAYDTGHYGFSEFIGHRPCRTRDERRRFYRNAGITLAVLHTLSATDCHHENLVAHGDQLVLVDAEALFETRGERAGGEDDGAAGGVSSVLQVGMLPAWLWLEGARTALDVSALGCSVDSTLRPAALGWRSVNTDAMTRGLVTPVAAHPVSLPTPPGTTPDLSVHVDDVVQGFVAGYRAVDAARGHELAALLADCTGLARRLIQRPTYVYALLLARSREPEALRSAAARGLVLEHLTRAYLGGEERAWALLAAEQDALARLDVPLFQAGLGGGITTWCGGALDGWPGVDSLAGVRARLDAMGEADLAWQESVIRATFAARAYRASDPTPPAAIDDPADPTPEHRAALERRIVERIVAAARHDGRGVTWTTPVLLPDGRRANVQRIGSGLYDGALGVAVSLYECGRADLAGDAVAPVLRELDHGGSRARRLVLTTGLGWSGAGGVLRALRHLERRGEMHHSDASSHVSAVIDAISMQSIATDRWLDVMNGAAGLVVPLAAELRRGDGAVTDRAAGLMAAAADRLVDRQHRDGGWPTLPGSPPLTGMAHGASGIALALAEAGVALADDRYLDAAVRGLRFESSTYDAEAGNWPDYRAESGAGFMLGWCAGAPGIALARRRLLELLPEHPDADAWRTDLEQAARATAAPLLLARDHLCCGNLGRVAVLHAIGQRQSRADWTAAAQRITDAVVARAGSGLPRSLLGPRAADGLAVPGLMTGEAGHALLLAGDPGEWVPGLLL